MIKEYIKKSIETESGYNAECWSVTGLWIDLKANCVVINLDGYKDFESKEAGKIIMGKKEVRIDGLEALPIFLSVHDTVVSTILQDPIFTSGTYEQVEISEEN